MTLRRNFESKKPKILGALLNAVINVLKNSDYNPDIDMRMLDAVKFILIAAHESNDSTFSEDKLKSVLIEKKKQKELSDVFTAPLAKVIFTMVREYVDAHGNSNEPSTVWNGSTTNLFKDSLLKSK